MDRKQTRVRFLSNLETASYDCCVNSCCCFLGTYENDDSCPFCGEGHYVEHSKDPRKKYTYTLLIPHLHGMYDNKLMCRELLYRHEHKLPSDSSNLTSDLDSAIGMTDIWDGKIYNELKGRHIGINGTQLNAKYFSDPHNLALGLSTDGFAPWHKWKYTAWPLLIINYNLPPDKQFHQKIILVLSVIPGPKKPKDIDSFL